MLIVFLPNSGGEKTNTGNRVDDDDAEHDDQF
jgi:hypothetical protein